MKVAATNKKEDSEAKRRRTVPGYTVTFNLSNDPCLRYELSLISDRGLSSADWLSSRLRKEVMYFENDSHRYELSLETRGHGRNAFKAALASLGPTRKFDPYTCQVSSFSDAIPSSGVSSYPIQFDTYQLRTVKKPVFIDRERQDDLPCPLPAKYVSNLEQSLQWTELRWGAQALKVRSQIIPIAKVFFVPRSSDAEMATMTPACKTMFENAIEFEIEAQRMRDQAKKDRLERERNEAIRKAKELEAKEAEIAAQKAKEAAAAEAALTLPSAAESAAETAPGSAEPSMPAAAVIDKEPTASVQSATEATAVPSSTAESEVATSQSQASSSASADSSANVLPSSEGETKTAVSGAVEPKVESTPAVPAAAVDTAMTQKEPAAVTDRAADGAVAGDECMKSSSSAIDDADALDTSMEEVVLVPVADPPVSTSRSDDKAASIESTNIVPSVEEEHVNVPAAKAIETPPDDRSRPVPQSLPSGAPQEEVAAVDPSVKQEQS